MNRFAGVSREVRTKALTRRRCRELESIVLNGWLDSNRTEARSLIEVMSSVPSTKWGPLLTRAQHHDVMHWELLLKAQDRIYEQIADADVAEDGLTTAV